jgi:cytochrome b subunit of formate dehydrogenase
VDIATYKHDVWGTEVLRGVSWDLLWLVLVAAFLAIVLHGIYEARKERGALPSKEGERVQRHQKIDRIFHWIMAFSMFALLITGILPIVGVKFAWLTLHWIAGLLLTVIVLLHILRSILVKDLKSVAISAADIREGMDASKKPGKYSLAQKGMHAAVSVITLVVIITGLVMFAMLDTPWWDRTNSLSESALGWTFFLHGLSTLALVGLISLHVYFALRPEKLFYLRAMFRGWISKDELSANHDPERWAPDETS